MRGKFLKRIDFGTEWLFVMAWSSPLTRLHNYFGVTDKALTNRLQAAGIPTPEGPFWAKREAGYFLGFPEFPPELAGKLVSWSVPDDFEFETVEGALDTDYRLEARNSLTSYVAPQPVSRMTLHNLVWSHPPLVLAAKLQSSPPSILEACRKYSIPRPTAQDWSNVAQNASMRGKPLLGRKDEIALQVRGSINVHQLMTDLPLGREVSLTDAPVGPAAEYLIRVWWNQRKDKKQASRAGAKHGLTLFHLAEESDRTILEFLKAYPKPPANKIRNRVKKFELGSANSAEILSSLASLGAYYQQSEKVIRSRAVAINSRSDRLDQQQRLSMVRTFLTWFENNRPNDKASQWRHARDHSMFALIHHCGLKIVELLVAPKTGLDLFRGTLTFDDEDGLRTWKLPQEVVLPLWRYGSSVPPNNSAYLFVNHHGQMLQRSGIDVIFNRRLAEAHLDKRLQLRSIRMTFDKGLQ